MNMTWEEIKKLRDDFVAKEIAKIPYKIGDAVEWRDGDKTVVGHVKYVSFDEQTGVPYLRVEKLEACGWITIGEKNFFSLDELHLLRKVENPVTPDDVFAIEKQIEKVENDLDITVRERQEKLDALKQELNELREKCIHEYEKFGEEGEAEALLGGKYTRYRWRCKICGKELVK